MSGTTYRRYFLNGLAGAAVLARPAQAQGTSGLSVFNVLDFGAVRTGRDFDTRAIQRAIDACAASGGGLVYFPSGTYHSGGLALRSNVHLYLESGATLLGSTNLEDFPKTIPRIRSYTDNYTERSLIYGEDLVNVGIHGDGVIDGQGAAYKGPYKVRPYMIRLINCKDVAVTGLTIRNSPMWVQHYLACDDVYIHGITVHSLVNANNDGIDIDCCHRVTISDCNINSGDDAIVLKSTSARATRDVAITNCVLRTLCNAFKLGTESNGGFENIVLSNCTMYDTRLSGIALEMVDGGLLDGVSITNVTMRDVKSVIFVRLGDRGRPFEEGGPRPAPGKLRNVQISNVNATGAGRIGCAISGIPGHSIENVAISDVHISFEGGVKEVPGTVPEHPDKYPEHSMFGTLPAYGFFCRHVENIRFRDVRTQVVEPDERPALVCEDVRDIEIAGSSFAAQGTAVKFRKVDGALIQGCRVSRPVSTFLDASAGATAVSVIGNDFARTREAVRGEGVFLAANRTKL